MCVRLSPTFKSHQSSASSPKRDRARKADSDEAHSIAAVYEGRASFDGARLRAGHPHVRHLMQRLREGGLTLRSSSSDDGPCGDHAQRQLEAPWRAVRGRHVVRWLIVSMQLDADSLHAHVNGNWPKDGRAYCQRNLANN